MSQNLVNSLQINTFDHKSLEIDSPLASASTNSSSSVRGPDGQYCESKQVLDAILTKYIHINSNLFKGGANGKIKAEYMLCECRYNHCKLLLII